MYKVVNNYKICRLQVNMVEDKNCKENKERRKIRFIDRPY